jgi:hypothetical protein
MARSPALPWRADLEYTTPGYSPEITKLLVSLMDEDFGYTDLEEKTLQHQDNLFGAKSVTHVSGTMCDLCLRSGHDLIGGPCRI